MNVSVPNTAEGREAFAEMKRIMETSVELTVPVIVDANLGANWDAAK
jgi:DNA polymerase I-like protein with 3'-5' exonuclease and polymerase domains